MALTRKQLKAIGLTEEQVESIVEMHTETVDALKDQIKTYKADAEKLPGVQKELDDLKTAGDGGYKEKYEKERDDFKAYKDSITEKETKAAKEAAVKAYFEGKNITGKALALAMRGAVAEIAAVELDGEKIKDSKALDDLIANDYAGLVGRNETMGANPANPAGNGGGNPSATTRAAEIVAKFHTQRYGAPKKE